MLSRPVGYRLGCLQLSILATRSERNGDGRFSPVAPEPAMVAGEGGDSSPSCSGHGAALFVADALAAAIAMSVEVQHAAVCGPGETGDWPLPPSRA